MQLCDNVDEWTCSAYAQSYKGGEQKCTTKKDHQRRVLQGGSWGHGAGGVRLANRISEKATARFSYVGFRVVINE